jgi:DNA-binding beta-propeller fold protein YncE
VTSADDARGVEEARIEDLRPARRRTRAADGPRGGFAVRPRTIVIAMLVIVIVAAAVVAWSLRPGRYPGRVRLAGLSADTTATVGFAGAFPADDEAPLANPLGIAWDGDRLYVAESDAGVIRVFDEAGGRIGSIVLPVAAGAQAVYPSVVAVADERLAIVDTAGNRVIVVDAEPADKAAAPLVVLGGDNDAPGQPVSVAYGDGEFYVVDASDSLVKVYDDEGAFVRSIGGSLEPALAFAGGAALLDGRLYVADSNGGRVVVLDARTGDQVRVFEDRYALPRAIVPVSGDTLAVVDTFGHAVYLVGADGVRQDAIDAATVPDGPLGSPRGAAWVDEDGRLYVTDAGAGRVLVYNVRLK